METLTMSTTCSFQNLDLVKRQSPFIQMYTKTELDV